MKYLALSALNVWQHNGLVHQGQGCGSRLAQSEKPVLGRSYDQNV